MTNTVFRDRHGKFVPGHIVLPDRDTKTGKFVPRDIHKEIDRVLMNQEGE